MSDLFNNIMKNQDSNTDNTKGQKTNNEESSTPSTSSKPNTSKSDDSALASKKDTRDKEKKSHKPSTQETLDKLTDVMTTGFQNLQQLFQGIMAADEEDLEELPIEEQEEPMGTHDDDMFQEVSNGFVPNNKRGPEVVSSLASLVDSLLKRNIDLSDKEVFDKYLAPKNIEFAETPQINKPVWGNMSHDSKRNDVKLQTIQKKFLSSSLPIIEVMLKLNEAKDDLNSLDVKDLVRKLSDSLAFTGAANVSMVHYRRSSLKKELPPNMHLLCQDSVGFSGSFLFGNELSSDIKEISELNKISQRLRGFRGTFRGRGRGRFRGSRGRGYYTSTYLNRGGGRVTKPFGTARGKRSFRKRSNLNDQGLSNQ